MKTTCDRQQAWLLKRFHTMCTKIGMTPEEKAALIGGFGVESSRDLSTEQLTLACDALDKRVNPELVEIDRWRKRLLASIGGWLRLTSQTQSIEKIKGIACRATTYKAFNDIPKDRLISIYYSFLQKQHDFKRVDGIVKEDLEALTSMN